MKSITKIMSVLVMAGGIGAADAAYHSGKTWSDTYEVFSLILNGESIPVGQAQTAIVLACDTSETGDIDPAVLFFGNLLTKSDTNNEIKAVLTVRNKQSGQMFTTQGDSGKDIPLRLWPE